MPVYQRLIKPAVDLVITLLLWAYFIFGYLLFFSPLFVTAFFFSRNRESSFQRLLHGYCRSFFFFMRLVNPRLSIRVHPDIFSLKSSVVVCNHLSYLDPLLLTSLFKNQKTIVKGSLFGVPIFGWILKTSGYIPSDSDTYSTLVTERLEKMGNFLAGGGILFVFPEGTRSRDGRIGRMHKGAFRIANRWRAPLEVLTIENSHRIFQPGKFLFNTWVPTTIRIDRVGRVAPVGENNGEALAEQMDLVRSMMENRLS